jgi:predicted transcriptional regulator
MFSVRLNDAERGLVTRIAERMERTESDAIRHVIREFAQMLGLMPGAMRSSEDSAQALLPAQR